MSSATRRNKLNEQIAEALGSADYGNRKTGQPTARSGLRNSIAYGSMVLLTANPILVGAAGLGEVTLQSQLGQPLSATIPLTLGPGESVHKDCIKPAPTSGTLAPPPDMRVLSPALRGPGTYELRVTTANPLHEPMYELSLMIKCQGNAMLVRQYVLMLDLPGVPVTEVAAQPATVPARAMTTKVVNARSRASDQRVPVANTPRTKRDSARLLPATGDAINAGGQYRVARGDTLSTIARRVEGRLPDTTWSVADRIFVDNPRAFIGGDPDLIKLGSVLRIPATAVLASLAPGYRVLASNGSTLVPSTADVASRPGPQQVPAPQPEAVNRDDTAVARRSVAETAQSVSGESFVAQPESAESTGAPDTPRVVTERADIQIATLAETPLAESPLAATPPEAATSPFADELPTPASEPSPASEIAVIASQAPVATPTVDEAEATGSNTLSSLLSIFIGLLLGAAVSLLALRGRLLAALGVGRRKQSVAPVISRPQTRVKSDTNEFDQSQAAAAFDRTADDADGKGRKRRQRRRTAGSTCPSRIRRTCSGHFRVFA